MAKKQISRQRTAIEYLSANPNASFDDFVEKTKNKNQVVRSDWYTAKYKLKTKNIKINEKEHFENEKEQRIRVSSKYPEASDYLFDNPNATYKTFLNENPNINIPCSTYMSMRNRIHKKNQTTVRGNKISDRINKHSITPRFRKSLLEVLAEIDVPNFQDKPKVINWVVNDLLGNINTNQSAFKFSMSKHILDDNKLEFRMSSSK